MQVELNKYRVLDAQRKEYECRLAEARTNVQEEKERSDSQINGLTESTTRERAQLETRIQEQLLSWRRQLQNCDKQLVSDPYKYNSSSSSDYSDKQVEVSFNKKSLSVSTQIMSRLRQGDVTLYALSLMQPLSEKGCSDRSVPTALCSSNTNASHVSVEYSIPKVSELLPTQSIVCPVPSLCKNGNFVAASNAACSRNPLIVVRSTKPVTCAKSHVPTTVRMVQSSDTTKTKLVMCSEPTSIPTCYQPTQTLPSVHTTVPQRRWHYRLST